MVYFEDTSDPHKLDKGVGGSNVCSNLPTLWSSVHEAISDPTGDSSEAKVASEGPVLFAQTQLVPDENRVILLVNMVALLLVSSGVLALISLWRGWGPFKS